jgi:segregation and condensation protein B
MAKMDDNIDMNEHNMLDDIRSDENSARGIIEALMIATTEPLPLRSIAEIVNVSEDTVRAYIEELNSEYHARGRAFEIKEIAGGFQIYTLPKFAEWVGALHKRKERLSKAALETLAIVAYHQPIIRADIEKIRGVDVTSVLDTLLQKNLIKTCGRMVSPGRPIKYGTTKEFLRYFGIRDISELPKEEDFGERVISGYPEAGGVQVDRSGVENGSGQSVSGDLAGNMVRQEESTGPGAENEPQEEAIVDFGVSDGEQDEEILGSDDEMEPQDKGPDSGGDSEQIEKVEDTEDKSEHF